tara:strand:- start:4349 stop:4624 length:276 start_codon:yes stop_codon:yes gene_type:complete
MSQLDIERKVNWSLIAIVVGLFANFGTIVWWGSAVESRITTNASNIEKLGNVLKENADERGNDRELLIRLDERTRSMADDIAALKKEFTKK